MDTTYHQTTASQIQKPFLKDPGSAVTHFIGVVFSAVAAAPLILKAYKHSDWLCTVSMAVFMASMLLLYSASTIYHSLDVSERCNRILRKLDHMMIFILIAGATLFFLMGAMTIVEIVDQHGGFNWVRGALKSKTKRSLLWKIAFMTAILSAVLDNLTTSIVKIGRASCRERV